MNDPFGRLPTNRRERRMLARSNRISIRSCGTLSAAQRKANCKAPWR